MNEAGDERYGGRQLRWVMANRRRVNRTADLADAAVQVMGWAADRRGPCSRERAGRLWRVLVAVVGEEAAGHCRLGSVRGGVVTILVDDARRAAAYQMRWAMELAERMNSDQEAGSERAGSVRAGSVRAVRFEAVGA